MPGTYYTLINFDATTQLHYFDTNNKVIQREKSSWE
jgi:hypothetical protein